MRRSDVAGAARLVLVDGATLLHPEPAMFEAMLTGWRTQQESRLLAEPTIEMRDKTIRRFQSFAGEYPWRWRPDDVEGWTVSLRSAGRSRTTIRAYQNALAMFCDYVCDARYGWVAECEERFGEHPVQICHEWNTADHVADYEGAPGRRPFTRAELQAFFDHADDAVAHAQSARPQGWVGGVAGLGAVQGHLRVGTAPPGGDDARHHRLLHQPGGTRARSVRDAVGPLRQGDAGQRTPPPQRGHGDAVGGGGAARSISPRSAPATRPAAAPALWLTERGGRISARHLNDRFGAYRDTLGLPVELTPHCLRHSYVSHLVEDGIDPLFVQQQVGHSHAADDGDLHLGEHRLPQPGAAHRARPGLRHYPEGGHADDRRRHLPLASAPADGRTTACSPPPTWWPLLAERGVSLSREQVYRLVVGTPERLNLATLAALCDILGGHPRRSHRGRRRAPPAEEGGHRHCRPPPAGRRPRRARIVTDD